MARPREFEQAAVLEAMVLCFWKQGYQATSMRDLIDYTGVNAASLYNAFGDKREIYRQALNQYVSTRIIGRIERCEQLGALPAIQAFFAEVLERTAGNNAPKGCLLANAALEGAPDEPEFRKYVNDSLCLIETFFVRCIESGQADGTITKNQSAKRLSRLLLVVHAGIKTLARTRPERALVEDAAASILAILSPALN